MNFKRNNEAISELREKLANENISDETRKSIEELISSYEYATYKEWSDKGDFWAKAMSDMVNDTCFDEQSLAKAMASDHPTLQQNYMRLFKAFVSNMAAKTYCDGRNENSVNFAKSIMPIVNESYFPFI